MVLHSDLHNVIASLAKFVSGNDNELRTNLSKSLIQFIYNNTYVTYLNFGYICVRCSYVEPNRSVLNYLLRYYKFQLCTFYNF